jgi:hypothetical protein
MRIPDYRFGRIVVEGRTYTSDVIICGDRVFGDWWRKEGHRVDLEDLKRVRLQPGVRLIIGTGYNDCMVVDPGLVEYCNKNRIILEAMPTPQAVARTRNGPAA